MSVLIDNSITIYEALEHIKDGKYVMPAFQRQYVWNMEQIEKLWDSILLDYPIATFLFWHVDDDNVTWDTYFCNFLSSVTFDSRKQDDSVNYELSSIDVKLTDTAVLDGQQRLTSLYLSLFGDAFIRQKHARKKSGGGIVTKLLIELNKNKLTVDEEEYNSKKYDIKFSEKVGKLSPTQFEIRKILEPKFQDETTREKAIEDTITNVPADSKDYARGILNKLYEKIFVEKLIRYTEIRDMKQDDALEMFVRFNSGGKALRKSEITMSILEAYWPSAKTEFGKLLVDSYAGFGSDFIIRAALMLYGDVIKSNINKQIAEELKNNWSEFKKALKNLEALLKEMKIEVSRFSSSWNVLLPIVYFIYYNPEYKDNTEGKNADYIPYLANINPKLFGISICLMNGEKIQLGDYQYQFGIESVSKVLTAILILRQYGAQKVLEMIGADATGLPFNSIMAILLENDHPSTPLVNAGAISADSMVQPIGNSDAKWKAIVDNMTELCGSAPQLIDELYKSESATNFNNRSIAWLLKNYNRIYDDPDMSLDLYTRQCSMGITADQLSVCAATIANDGLNPDTKKQVFDKELAPKITSLIATVGFYQHTGDWLYTSGVPAKTGVGGGVLGVMPGIMGIAAFAPPLDEAGNSVKAQLAIKYIMNKLGMNLSLIHISEPTRPY